MIQGIPTNYGIEILNSELKKEVQTYALVGLPTPKDEGLQSLLVKEDLAYDEVRRHIFFTHAIDVGYFDENEILTYEINLQHINTDKYMYGILLLDTKQNIVCALPTPQVVLIEGVGGLMTIKLPIKGAVNEVVFVSSDYVSRAEFEVLKKSLKPPKVDIPALVEQVTPLIQAQKEVQDNALKILDECIAHCKFLLLYKKDNARDNARIGEYKLFFRNELPKGYKPLGSILSIVKYPKAFLYFKGTSPQLQENCPQGYFRLPRPSIYAKGTNDIARVGSFEPDGLPNIEGGVYTISRAYQSMGSAKGAFKKLYGYASDGNPQHFAHSTSDAFDLNASRSSPIYGRTQSVEVNANRFLEGIYVG